MIKTPKIRSSQSIQPAKIPTRIISGVLRENLTPRQVEKEFRGLLSDGFKVVPAGSARNNPQQLFSNGLWPKHKIQLFDVEFYLTNVRQIPELRFIVGYVVLKEQKTKRKQIFPRLFYKDLSLVWRSASHFMRDPEDDGIWVGKGDVRYEMEDGKEMVVSVESTTDLPTEMQNAMEGLLSWTKRASGREIVLDWVLRKSPLDRVEPYQDFTSPRLTAAADSRNLVNRGKSIARFTRKNDPASLKFTAGFEPDFDNGILETSESRSSLYGGKLRRFRILSTNQKVQYIFIAGTKHVWIIPPQATTTELSSYGVRTIDVVADDDLFIPGYEYHHFEETKHGLELYSQIPPGFAGDVCPYDPDKADASPWLNEVPIIKKFRRDVLKQHK